ncbi:unnamed protein product [Owenia fusiformis]|uniref:Uncharacterized protein n=1 Tax=Owenia fusiformis TaxID=6347 RepID=A0A8J1Y4Q1_OWEFU|nr:unnamed protein product [Owenia fusiformis]
MPSNRMPVAAEDDSGIAAFEDIKRNLHRLQSAGATDEDLSFLSDVLNDPVMNGLVQVHDTLDEASLEPVSANTIELVKNVLMEIDGISSKNKKASDLKAILSKTYVKSLVETHDDIAAKNYEESLYDESFNTMSMSQAPPPVFAAPATDAVRMVGIRKNGDEPLGITVRIDNNNLVIARILAGSMIDQQGLLHVGDIIKEINGQEVISPDQLQDQMQRAVGSITLKILPSYVDHNIVSQVYMKAHFNYDPMRDNLIPCREAGLPFRDGEILQILNMDDNNWWQARKIDGDESFTGLVPSITIEEKRRAFVKPEYDYTTSSYLCGIVRKKKKKTMYKSKQSSEFDRHEMMIYEEVARMPPFQRKTLVLVGAQGVGRRTLKNKLIESDPNRFGTTMPHTTREMREDEENGNGYWFVDAEEMKVDISEGKYLEYGEFDGNLYGTKLDTIRQVIRSGRMCIIDCNPQALKTLKTGEFMPYIVFVAAPSVEVMSNMHELAKQQGVTTIDKTEREFRNTLDESARVERAYKHYFDTTIINDNMGECFNTLRRAIETLSMEPQWVPVSWVY